MGYYINTEEVEFFMSKRHFEAAYKDMCLLNKYDHLKSGGSFGGENDAKSSRPAGLNYHPRKWFSWMDADYPSKLNTAIDILQSLGFDLSFDEYGNIVHMHYDNKAGQQDLFLEVIAPYVKDGSYIIWRGEDGAIWKDIFDNGTMKTSAGRVVFDFD